MTNSWDSVVPPHDAVVTVAAVQRRPLVVDNQNSDIQHLVDGFAGRRREVEAGPQAVVEQVQDDVAWGEATRGDALVDPALDHPMA